MSYGWSVCFFSWPGRGSESILFYTNVKSERSRRDLKVLLLKQILKVVWVVPYVSLSKLNSSPPRVLQKILVAFFRALGSGLKSKFIPFDVGL